MRISSDDWLRVFAFRSQRLSSLTRRRLQCVCPLIVDKFFSLDRKQLGYAPYISNNYWTLYYRYWGLYENQVLGRMNHLKECAYSHRAKPRSAKIKLEDSVAELHTLLQGFYLLWPL